MLAAAVTNGLLATVPDDVEATFGFEDVQAEPRTANVTVQLDPADFVDDPSWVQITSWQGDGLVVTPLERTGEGAYRTTEPVPLHGTWKTLLRIHDGRTLTAVPIYLPADEAIGAEEVPAEDGVTRSAVPETEILQRELKDDSPGWLWAAVEPRRAGLHAGADRGDLLGRRPLLPPRQPAASPTRTPRRTRPSDSSAPDQRTGMTATPPPAPPSAVVLALAGCAGHRRPDRHLARRRRRPCRPRRLSPAARRRRPGSGSR